MEKNWNVWYNIYIKNQRSSKMKTKTKTVFKGPIMYRLTYSLTETETGFKLLIRSEEFEAKSYFSKKGTPPRFSEESFATLTNTTLSNIESLFNELSENLVFPCSLQYIVEDAF